MSTPTFSLPDADTLNPTPPPVPTPDYAPPATGLRGVIQKLPRAFATIAAYRGNPGPLREIDDQEQREDRLKQQAFSDTITSQREQRAQQLYDYQLQNFKAELAKRQFDQQEAQRKQQDQIHTQAAIALASHVPPELLDQRGMPDMTKLAALPNGPDIARSWLEVQRGLPKGDSRKLAFDASGKGYWADSESQSITPAMIGSPTPAAPAPAGASPMLTMPGGAPSPQPRSPMMVGGAASPTPQPQQQQFSAPSLKMPFPFGTPDAGIEAAVGPVPNPRSYALGMADPKFREDLGAWGNAYNAAKLARDKELAAARGAAFSQTRPIPGGVYDPNLQATVVATPGGGTVYDPRTHQPMLSGNQAGAYGTAMRRATFSEVDKNLANVRQFIPVLDKASTTDRMAMATALTPARGDTLLGKAGQIAEGYGMRHLSQDQRQLINTIRNLRQGVSSLRTVIAGAGGGSDHKLDILESEMPNEQDLMGSSAAMQQKLQIFESVYNEILDSYPQVFMGQQAPSLVQPPTRPPKARGGARPPLTSFESH